MKEKRYMKGTLILCPTLLASMELSVFMPAIMAGGSGQYKYYIHFEYLFGCWPNAKK